MARRAKNLNMLGYQALFHEDRDRIDRLHPILGGYKRRIGLGEYKHNIFLPGMYICMLIISFRKWKQTERENIRHPAVIRVSCPLSVIMHVHD